MYVFDRATRNNMFVSAMSMCRTTISHATQVRFSTQLPLSHSIGHPGYSTRKQIM